MTDRIAATLSLDLEDAFSLLPAGTAREAVDEALQQIRNRNSEAGPEITWAEFDPSGTFLRGGASNLLDMSTSLVTRAADHPDVAVLARYVADNGADPGRIERLPGVDRFLWFLPFVPRSSEPPLDTPVRGLSVSARLLADTLALFNRDARLTMAECRVAFQIVAGLSPQQAAAEDDVSVETKRAQLKAVCQKLDCRGQSDLVRRTLSQLVYLNEICGAEDFQARATEAFIAKYLARDARLTTQRLQNGRVIRYLECGAKTGRPVVLIHGMMWPIILAGSRRPLSEAGLRLIMPIRRGYLQPGPALDLNQEEDLATLSMHDIAGLVAENLDAPAVILGNSLGAVLAAGFAGSYPHLVSRLVLLSINLAQTQSSEATPAGQYYASLNRLRDRADLFRRTVFQYRKYYAEMTTCQDILNKMFHKSDRDVGVLSGKYGQPPVYSMFSELFQLSAPGIAEDYAYVMRNGTHNFAKLRRPTTFLHGTDDPLTTIDEIAAAISPGAPASIASVDGGGHFIGASDADLVWQRVASLAG